MPANDKTGNALLIDLDGVIYQGDSVVVGAADTLGWLRAQKIPYLFVTNTTSRSRLALLDKFESLGFSAGVDEIVTPIVAASRWLKSQKLSKATLFVAENALEDFTGVERVSPFDDIDVDAVIIGDLGEAWTFRMLNSAFRLLMRDPKPVLIALGMTRYWRAQDGLRLDVAPFIRALECASNCEALVIGKPASAFFESSLALLNRSATQTLMIGDDIVGDIDGAQRCVSRGLQVKTGKFREDDLKGTIKPFAILDSIAALPSWWSNTLIQET